MKWKPAEKKKKEWKQILKCISLLWPINCVAIENARLLCVLWPSNPCLSLRLFVFFCFATVWVDWWMVDFVFGFLQLNTGCTLSWLHFENQLAIDNDVNGWWIHFSVVSIAYCTVAHNEKPNEKKRNVKNQWPKQLGDFNHLFYATSIE